MPYFLSTERLTLRPFTLADASFILELLNEPAFIRFVGDRGLRTHKDAEQYLRDRPMASYTTHGFGLLAVEIRATGSCAGMCGLVQRDHLDAPDLGFTFLAPMRRKGYATEASRAVLRHACDHLGYRHVYGITQPRNEASLRTLHRLGFEQVGTTQMAATGPLLALLSVQLAPTREGDV